MSTRLFLGVASSASAASLRRGCASRVTSAAAPDRLLAARFLSSAADDGDIKMGTVKYFLKTKKYGFITPDGLAEGDNNMFFVHQKDIAKLKSPNGVEYLPNLYKNDRVQFKVGPSDNGKPGQKACDVRMENGKLVPMFREGHFESFVKAKKTSFGEGVYEIMTTSDSQHEMEEKIVEAFEKTKADIQRQQERIEKACGLHEEA